MARTHSGLISPLSIAVLTVAWCNAPHGMAPSSLRCSQRRIVLSEQAAYRERFRAFSRPGTARKTLSSTVRKFRCVLRSGTALRTYCRMAIRPIGSGDFTAPFSMGLSFWAQNCTNH
ncbi:resolvase [Deinococcus radiodurans R1 = ATCC 13939 = DSM 20539]|nr:resolvase [Deinococcus radiodurans R1 = ATCC 13939 = DSM 20539]